MTDPFADLHGDYARCLRLALTNSGSTWRAAACEFEDLFDAGWHRASCAMPPLSRLDSVRLSRRRLHFFLWTVSRQAAFPDESFLPANDAFALAVQP